MQVSALIIEDHPIYRDALSSFMQTFLKKEQILATASIEEVSNLTARIEQLKIIFNGSEFAGIERGRCRQVRQEVLASYARDRHFSLPGQASDQRSLACWCRPGYFQERFQHDHCWPDQNNFK